MSDEVIAPTTQGIAQIAPDARAAAQQAMLGPGQKRLQMQRQSAYLDLKNSGRLRPATIINFNPVSLLVDDGHVPWRIPACTDANKKGIEVTHGGKVYVGAVFTIREPSFVPWIRDVRPPSDEGENPSSEYDPKFILPLELADQYRQSYVEQVGRIQMGGIVVFEGDVHAFTKSKTVRIPKFTTLPDRTRSYFSEEVDLQKELSANLAMQKVYCQGMIQQADEYYQDETERKNITPPHRIWMKYALDMGWKEIQPPWMNASLETEESCRGCGKGRKRTDAWFCECGRPFNAYAAFMAGENVPESYLFALKGKELDDVLAELGKREALKAKFRPKA